MLEIVKSTQRRIMEGDRFFRWRGGDVSRLESLFDAVIALALTLIVVSVEVPSSFDALLDAFKRLPAFAICFAILVMCWYYNFLFHRRYGIEDFPITILNSVLMFLVVFYVYPLKFLYAFMFSQAETTITREQVPLLMYMYSGGFLAIFTNLLIMYAYAYTKRVGLELSESEVLLTKMKLSELSIYVLFGVLSILLVAVWGSAPLAGLVYCLIGPAQGINGYLWGRQLQDASAATPAE
ncbi:MAG: hypothetical protein Aurels2KO_45040 [Aureliella sp.]